jgi:hypothetical protein
MAPCNGCWSDTLAGMRCTKVLLAAALVAGVWTGTARAACPYDGIPSKKACEPIDAYLMPGLVGLVYWPSGSGQSSWLGAGVQIVPFLWSHNTEKFGPGQGKVLFDVGVLGSDDDAAGKMLMYRGGLQLSLERNASRIFAIPFFGFFFGGMNERSMEHQSFVETTLGMHALYLKNAIVTFEMGYLFPFDQVDELAGWRATVAVNVTMW